MVNIITNFFPVVGTVVVKNFTFWAVQTFKIAPSACCWAFFNVLGYRLQMFQLLAGVQVLSRFLNVSCTHTYQVPTIQNTTFSSTAGATQRYDGGNVFLLFIFSVSCVLLNNWGLCFAMLCGTAA